MKFKAKPTNITLQKPRKTFTTVSLPTELYHTVTIMAKKTGSSSASLIRQMIVHCLKEMGGKING